MEVPPISYTRSGDVAIAYQVLGDGPIDLVFVPEFSNLIWYWQHPLPAGFFRDLASFSRLILLDKRGVGLSDRPRNLGPLETRMDDIRAVLDAVGSERAALFGLMSMGRLCVLFAATYPERTEALVTFGTLARPPEAERAANEGPRLLLPDGRQLREARMRWGEWDYQASEVKEGMDREYVDWWVNFCRLAASPGAAAHYLRMVQETDVSDIVSAVHVPARWLTPDGRTLVAPLPAGVEGHFGPELKRFVLLQHHQGQVTTERITAFLAGLGVAISKRQVVRLLTAKSAALIAEAKAVLRAGLATAHWITVDDTGARHRAKNGVTTQIGDDRFAFFATSFSKSRRNFLEILRAGHEDYVLNAVAFAYMQERGLAGPVIDQLSSHPIWHFADRTAWHAHLEALGLTRLKVTPDPVKIASEGALWGSICSHGLLEGTVIVSDDAGQFRIGSHALCWVHAERLVHQLIPFNHRQRLAIDLVRQLIWWFYADLKAYKRAPCAKRRAQLRARFDRIFKRRTGFVTLDRLLARLHGRKDELLLVLDRPEIPLHTNGSENDIRCHVTKRKVSGGTWSAAGRDARDAGLGLMKTCHKQGLTFFDYLGARLSVPGAPLIPPLPDLIRARATP